MDFEYDKKRAMKQTDFTKCLCCGKGMMHSGLPLFFRISIERMGVDPKAVERQAGLEMTIGSPVIAHIMGRDEDMGIPIGDKKTALLCHDCTMDPSRSMMEIISHLDEQK